MAPFRLPVTYTVTKEWNNEEHPERRPQHQAVLIYYNEDLHTLKKVQLVGDPEKIAAKNASADENESYGEWSYTWNDEGTGRQYKVRELGQSGNGWETGHDEDDAYLKDGIDNSYSYYSPNFMNIPSEEYSHTINRQYDDDGDLREYDRWWYSLEREEYDSETHTWTKYNKYNEEHIVRTLVPFREQKLEVGIRKTRNNYSDNSLMSTSDRALNLLRRGDDVTASYNVYGYGYIMELTKNSDADIDITSFGFKDVTLELEDNYGEDSPKEGNKNNTLLFDSAIRLTPDDAEIAYVNLARPTYLHYYQPDKYSPWTFRTLTAKDFGDFDCPDEELWGLKDGEWVRLATVHVESNGSSISTTVSTENGATKNGMNITMPTGVWKVKTVMTVPGLNGADNLDRRIDGVRMSYDIGIRLLAASETIQERLEALFEANDYAMSTLDNYALINAYEEEGDLATSLDDQSRSWFHGRNHRVAVRQEKDFHIVNNDNVRRKLQVHSTVTMTQQSNVLESAEYWDAREEGLIPSTESGTWYDLLPLGILPDVDTVKLTNGDKITDVYTIPNYKESGRVMLVVKAQVQPHVSYTYSTDYNPYRSDITYPKEGYKDVHTLEFDAYYAWDEARLYGIDNVRNVAAYEADEPALGNIEGWRGEPDDPTKNHNQRAMDAVGDDKILMTGLDKDRDPDNNAFVYSGAVMRHEELDFSAETQLQKYVTRDGLGVWTSGRTGRTQVEVYEGDFYSYMLYVASDSETTTKNIILMDSLETYVPTEKDEEDYGRGRWQGRFDSLDLTPLTELGIAPTVYYNTEEVDLSILKEGAASENGQTAEIEDPDLVINYLNDPANGWTTELPDDPGEVRSIAIDLRYMQDGREFELPPDENLNCTVRMRARVYDTVGEEGDPFNADEELRKAAENNDYAFNNVYLGCTQVDAVARQTHAVINYNYVRVGILPFELKVKKVWDDAGNNDGKRPNAITVHLVGNGTRMEEYDPITLDDSNDWTGKFSHVIRYDEDGNWITYTFEEESADPNPAFNLEGYTLTTERKGENVTLTNTYTPEKTRIPFVKKWETDGDGLESEELGARPDSITVRLMADGVFTGKTVLVKPDRTGNWSGEFKDLPKYTNESGLSGSQHEIEYTVEEVHVDLYEDAYEKDQETGTITITNTYWPKGNLMIQKRVTNATAPALENEFTFTLLLKDTEGNDVTEKFGAMKNSDFDSLVMIGNGDTFTLKDGEHIVVVELPAGTRYEVVESDTPGFTMTGAVAASGTVRASRYMWQDVAFTNRYNAAGSQTISLYKTLTGRTMSRYQFRFELVDKGYTYTDPDSGEEITEPGTDEVVRTASADAEGNAMFSRLAYTEADHGKTFIYELREVDREKPGYTYDENTYTVRVTVTDNGDGTMTCVPKYYKADGTEIADPADHENGVVFHNEYHASGSIALRAWKQLPDGELSEYNTGDNVFKFRLSKVDNDPASETYGQAEPLQEEVACDEKGTVTFDALDFTEADAGKTYLYLITEIKGTDERVIYDDTLRGVELSIVDNGNGTLAITQTNVTITENDGRYTRGGETTELPVFVNHLEPGDISVTKLTTWAEDVTEPDGDMEFSFSVTLVGEELPEKITVQKSEVTNTKAYSADKAPAPLTDAEKAEKEVELTITSPENVRPQTGVYEFTLKAGQKLAVKDLPAGTAYQFQETIPSGWTLAFENVAGVVRPQAEQPARYTNTYEPGSTTVTVLATKRLDGGMPPAKKFAFELVDDNEGSETRGDALQTLWNHASGYVLFDLTYRYSETASYPQTWHYLLREVQKPVASVSEAGEITYSEDEAELRTIEFDENEYGVTVVVNKLEDEAGNITLTAAASYDENENTPPQFKNATRPGSLQITKAGEGLTEANKDAEFTFKVKLSNDAGMPLTGSGSTLWYAQESEETTEPEPVPEDPGLPENAEPAPEETPETAPAGNGPKLNAPRMRLLAAPAGNLLAAAGSGASGGSISSGYPSAGATITNTYNNGSLVGEYYSDGTYVIRPSNGVSATATAETFKTVVGQYKNRAKVIKLSGTIKLTGSSICVFQYAVAEIIDLTGLDTSGFSNSDVGGWIADCANLVSVDFSTVDYSVPMRGGQFFARCPKLENLILGPKCTFQNYGTTSWYQMFQKFPSLRYLDLSMIDNRSNPIKESSCFEGDTKLAVVVLGENIRFNSTGGMPTTHVNAAGQSVTTYWVRVGDSSGTRLTTNQLFSTSYNASRAGTWVWEDYDATYTIRFDGNGEAGNMDPLQVDFTESVNLPPCTFQSELKFAGWSLSKDAIVPDYEDQELVQRITGASPGGTVTLYALWVSEDSFLLNFDANGGYSRTQWMRVNGPTDTVNMPVPTHPSNYEFLYWTTEADGSGERFSGEVSGAAFNAEPDAIVKLYAQYLDPSARARVTVEHYQQNADLEGYTRYEVDQLGAYDLGAQFTPEKKTNYKGFILPSEFKVLKGTSVTEETQADGTAVTVVKGGITVRYYYDRTQYTLKFEGNPGEGEEVTGIMADMSMIGGVPAKLPVNRFAKDNAVFVGWNTAADGSGTNYGDGQSINSIAGDGETVTLYAQWYDLDDAQSAEPTNGEYTVRCKANETIVFPSLPAGTHYTVTEVDLPDGWSLKGIENDTGTVLSAERVNVTATNIYSAVGYADLMAHKALPGERMSAGQFTFELRDEDGEVLQTVANGSVDEAEEILSEETDEEGDPISIPNPYYGMVPVRFDTIQYEKQGIYHYTIREVQGKDPAITYDEHVENVTVVVKDRGDGRLTTQVLYDASGADFRNDMSPGDLTVSKAVRNTTDKSADKSFFFTVYLFDRNGQEITKEFPVKLSNGGETTVRSRGGVQIKGGESFTITGLPHQSTYTVVESPADGFEIAEKSGDEGTIQAGETAEAAFTNAYFSTTMKGTGAVIEATKSFKGGEIQEEQFEFRLLDSSGEEVETVYVKPDGTAEFSALHYTLEDNGGRFVYYVEEVPGDDPDIDYDTHRERVNVTVEDNGDGSMTATVEYAGETDEERRTPPVFTNIVNHGDLKITKETKNTTVKTEVTEFTFTLSLKDAEGNAVEGEFDYVRTKAGEEDGTAIETGKVGNGGKLKLKGGETVLIKKLPYLTEYEVTEEAAENFELTNKTGDTGTIGPNETSEATFENTDVMPYDGSVMIQAKKVLKNAHLTAGQFSFELVDANKDSATYGEVIDTANVSAEGNVTFKKIAYSDADLDKTYTYTIREVKGTDPLMKYDEHEETVTVKVTGNADRTITATAEYDADGAVFTNEKLPELIDIPVEKVWDDGEDQDKVRPEKITVQLLADGKAVEPAEAGTVTLTAADGWKHSFKDLPKMRRLTKEEQKKAAESAGVDTAAVEESTWYDEFAEAEIVYTVEEAKVAEYKTSITGDSAGGFVITNTHEPMTYIDIDVTKVWDDQNDKDGIRPAKVTVELLADGKAVKSVSFGEAEEWKYTFKELPKSRKMTKEEQKAEAESKGIDTTKAEEAEWYDELKMTDIVYELSEVKVSRYESRVEGDAGTGFTVTNTYEPKKLIDIDVTKVWEDEDNLDKSRPDAIEVKLLAEGVAVKTQKITAADGWKYTFKDLPKERKKTETAALAIANAKKPADNDGAEMAEIVYTVEETPVAEYETSITGDAAAGFTVTNRHEVKNLDIRVTKIWEDEDNLRKARPAKVTVHLLADGREKTTATLFLDNNWEHTFKNLPRYDKATGDEIVYTVTEDAVRSYSTNITGDAGSGFEVVNSYELPRGGGSGSSGTPHWPGFPVNPTTPGGVLGESRLPDFVRQVLGGYRESSGVLGAARMGDDAALAFAGSGLLLAALGMLLLLFKRRKKEER